MSKTKIFKLALSEDDIAKIEAMQQILPGQPYKSDVIRAGIYALYDSWYGEMRKKGIIQGTEEEDMIEMWKEKGADNNDQQRNLYSKEGIIGVRTLMNDLDKLKIYLSMSEFEAERKKVKDVDNDISTILSFMVRKTFKK